MTILFTVWTQEMVTTATTIAPSESFIEVRRRPELPGLRFESDECFMVWCAIGCLLCFF